jgi:pimeloyl-ACP methyl ester carboxylesterase
LGIGLADYRVEFAAFLPLRSRYYLANSTGAVLTQQLAAPDLARALILVSPAPRADILPTSDSEKDLAQSLMSIAFFWKTVINPILTLPGYIR